MNFLNNLKQKASSLLFNTELDLSTAQAHERWYAFEKSGPLQLTINSDETSVKFSRQSVTVDGLKIKNQTSSMIVENYLKVLKFHHLNISKAIEQTKKKMTTLTPLQNDKEAQDLEWFKVSMRVASESVKNFNPLTSDLEYKVFSGTLPDTDTYIMRVMYYNLDILFEINDSFTFRFKDNKGSSDKTKHVIKEAKIEFLYNDFLNILISFLVELKATETKVLAIECEY